MNYDNQRALDNYDNDLYSSVERYMGMQERAEPEDGPTEEDEARWERQAEEMERHADEESDLAEREQFAREYEDCRDPFEGE